MVFGCITLFKLLHKISLTYLLPAMFPNPWNKVSSHVEKICVKALCVCLTKSCVYVCVCAGGQIVCEGVVCHKVVFGLLVCDGAVCQKVTNLITDTVAKNLLVSSGDQGASPEP